MVAAKSVGQVLAQRCREAGITAMILHEEEHDEKSQKVGDSVVHSGRTSAFILLDSWTSKVKCPF